MTSRRKGEHWLTVNELKRYEEIVPPHTPRPNINTLPYDSTKKFYFIVFDTETTCTGKMAELCQLSAVSEDGQKEFSTFILPKGNISFGASLVNSLSVKNIKGTTILDKSLGTNVYLWLFTNMRNKESRDIQATRAQPLPPPHLQC